MSNKIINVEIPVYNRDDVFNKCFLKGLKYLTSLKDYIDISILYNGPNITDDFITQSNEEIKKLGFELFYDRLPLGELENDIVQIRDRVHRISKKDYALVLQLDDDIEFLSEGYSDILRAAARKMLENPKIGVICFQKSAPSERIMDLFPADGTSRQYTSGGLLLKNIKDWNSIYPDEAKELHGSWSDILVSFVRLKNGYSIFQLHNPHHNHYEVRKKMDRKPGFSAHKWSEFYRQNNSSVMWLKKQQIQVSGGMPLALLKEMWLPEKTITITKQDLKNTNLSFYKKLSIEIPSCNRSNALFKYLLPSLKHLVSIKDQVVLCFNYNGTMDEEKRAAANQIIEELGFEYYWKYSDYHFEKGKTETIRMREDAHLYPEAKYSLLLDDDIEFVSEEYTHELIKCLDKLDNNDSIGAICFCKPMKNDKKRCGQFYLLQPKTHAWMDGGLLIRNIKEWNGIFPKELRHLFGTGEDRLCLTVRINKGFDVYQYYSQNIIHFEHHNNTFRPGREIYCWDNTWDIEGSILNYYKKLGFNNNRWVYRTKEDIVPNIKKEYKPKRILNIELPVCDKNTFFKRLFLSVRYLVPIAEYCYFVINYQKDFSQKDMKMINNYLKRLGFEVISTYSVYNFDRTNHSIMQIRNDTRLLKPETPFILSIDSDMKVLNKNYAKEILAMLYLMVKNDNIGVIGLENDYYHWPSKPKSYEPKQDDLIVPTDVFHHIWATGQGLMLRNIQEWDNNLVPKYLCNKIGCHQDSLLVIERFMKGYEVYAAKTKNAETLLDKEYNRGRLIYGWSETSAHPNSIDTYLKPYRTDFKDDRFLLSTWPKEEKYWDDESRKFDINKYSFDEIKALLHEAMEEKGL